MADINELEINSGNLGLNLDSQISQIKKGQLTFAMNAQVENFDGNKVSYQNEQSNVLCTEVPKGYVIVGTHNIFERSIIVVFLTDPDTGNSEIGKIVNCKYITITNSTCLNFHVDFPIKKAVHKINNNGDIEVYWTDGRNPRRWINIVSLPLTEVIGDCVENTSTILDCNKLNIQPNFSIPNIYYKEVIDNGQLIAGTYQFAIQYSNPFSEGYTDYYSITNPISIFYDNAITPDYNYPTSKAISLLIRNIDVSKIFTHFNLAVIETVNNISTVKLVGTYEIRGAQYEIVYSGATKDGIRLSMEDIFSKSTQYNTADDVTTVSDIIVWKGLTTPQKVNYQKIANRISLKWTSFKLPKEGYKDPINTGLYKGYFRDEVYAYEFVPILRGGFQADRFHIPGRAANSYDIEYISNSDVIDESINDCDVLPEPQPRWKVYNTATKLINGEFDPNTKDECYVGPYDSGQFAYWESTERYPCDINIWGELADTPIRHHKFPDSTISYIQDSKECIYPLGVEINPEEVYQLIETSDLSQEEKDNIIGFKITRGNRVNHKSVVARGLISNVGKYTKDNNTYFFPNYIANDLNPDPLISHTQTGTRSGVNSGSRLNAFESDDSKKRIVFHSPDTHFYQPFLGNILKLESAIYGDSISEVVEVKNHSRYKFMSATGYSVAVGAGIAIGFLSTGLGSFWNGSAGIATFGVVLDLINKLIPKKSHAYQINALNKYEKFKVIPNEGNKQKRLDLAVYLNPGIQGVGDIYNVNNFQRESSVYLRATSNIPFVHTISGVPKDNTKWILDENECVTTNKKTCSTYYATIKRPHPDQYGQLFTYESLDTGYQSFRTTMTNKEYIFGGDCFINKFGYKTKFPFFIDHRVGFPDEADIFYDELGNVAYPIFWMSTDVIHSGQSGGSEFKILAQILGVQVNNFSCETNKFFYKDGKIYLFAYGIQYFYCESEVNVDARQAYNTKEGDYFPRVGSDIPSEWLQEINVTIQQDNTYFYNKSFSKQNKENLFTYNSYKISNYPNRVIFSERQEDFTGEGRNNWLIYRPISFYDFPLNYGKLTSIDGIENRQVLVRFENKSSIYNALLTSQSSAGRVFLGQSIFNKEVPPLDFAETDMGYAGSQHKFLLRTEYGHIFIDSKRGNIFLVKGQQIVDLGKDTAGQFFNTNLGFEITKNFPDIDIDNSYNGIGLHGVYDSKYNRLLITKLDYKLIDKEVVYKDGRFYKNGTKVELSDTKYFENKCFTISYDFDIQNWDSFHSYTPKYYIGNVNQFYSGNGNDLWIHNEDETSFCKFYGKPFEYSIEYPYSYQANETLLTHISDFSRVLKYNSDGSFIDVNNIYFNKVILYNNQQCSGLLKLTQKPKNNLSQYMKFPKFNIDNKEITYTKVNNQYTFNDITNLVKDNSQPFFIRKSDMLFKQLNQDNIEYKNKSYNKSPLVAKDLKVRYILDDKTDYKIISQFVIAPVKPYVL